MQDSIHSRVLSNYLGVVQRLCCRRKEEQGASESSEDDEDYEELGSELEGEDGSELGDELDGGTFLVRSLNNFYRHRK